MQSPFGVSRVQTITIEVEIPSSISGLVSAVNSLFASASLPAVSPEQTLSDLADALTLTSSVLTASSSVVDDNTFTDLLRKLIDSVILLWRRAGVAREGLLAARSSLALALTSARALPKLESFRILSLLNEHAAISNVLLKNCRDLREEERQDIGRSTQAIVDAINTLLASDSRSDVTFIRAALSAAVQANSRARAALRTCAQPAGNVPPPECSPQSCSTAVRLSRDVVSPTQINISSSQDGNVTGTSVVIPAFLSSLLGENSGGSVLVSVSTENPYGDVSVGSEGAISVKAPLLSISLLDENSTEIGVSNLSSDEAIRFTLKLLQSIRVGNIPACIFWNVSI